MKIGLDKYLPSLLISAVMVATTGTALADTQNKPYIKTFGADVMTGGWFKNGDNCSSDPTTTNYQNPDYTTNTFAGDNRSGGILTYTRLSQRGGDSSQYAALSLGKVDGGRGDLSDGSRDGFYSSGVLAGAGSATDALTFANNANSPFGGFFEGSIAQGHCIPDYFSKVDPSSAQALPNNGNWRPTFVNNSPGGTYFGNAPAGNSLDLFETAGPGDMVLRAGKKIAIFVNGSVYINNNVIYDSASKVDKVPKFALIVKGSIYVDPNVTELDGLYIAQPADDTAASLTSDTGIFWSCHPRALDPIKIYYPPSCNKPLAINGAVIAKQANLLRVGGTAANNNSDVSTTANTGEDNLNTVGNCTNSPGFPNCHVSETTNYTPAVIMGGSFFDTSSGSTGNLKIDSLISLPPVF
jgi:hypothetical protein